MNLPTVHFHIGRLGKETQGTGEKSIPLIEQQGKSLWAIYAHLFIHLASGMVARQCHREVPKKTGENQ
jgi:hypothetical protein